MYKKPFVLTPTEHAELTVAATKNYHFAAKQMYLPIVYLEMADAAREYPIVFLEGQPGIFVLTGLEENTNAYVSEDGKWQATYVPAILQNYPFALAQHPEEADEFLVALDAEAEQVLAQDGERLFINGETSPMLKQRLALLEKTKRAEPLSHAWVERLKEAGLLVEQAIRIERDGQISQITGVLMIDEDKLNALSAEDFLTLRTEGLLPLIYAHLLSLANLRQGAIAGKYPQLAAASQDVDTAEEDAFGISLGGDTLKFNF